MPSTGKPSINRQFSIPWDRVRLGNFPVKEARHNDRRVNAVTSPNDSVADLSQWWFNGGLMVV